MSSPAVRLSHIVKRFPGVVALDDVTVEIAGGSCHALCGENGAGKSTLGKIVAVDALPAELAYVERGLAPVLLAQPTYLWGYVSVQRIFDKIQLKKEVPAIIPMELVRVSKENLGTWAKQLQEWGFTDVPPEYLK